MQKCRPVFEKDNIKQKPIFVMIVCAELFINSYPYGRKRNKSLFLCACVCVCMYVLFRWAVKDNFVWQRKGKKFLWELTEIINETTIRNC